MSDDATVGTSGAQEGRRAPRRWPKRLLFALGAVILLAASALIAVSVIGEKAQPGEPGPFYDTPESLPSGGPGTVIRSEVVPGYAKNATTHRVLYVSTGLKGEPTAVSGMILVPDAPAPSGGRPVLVYTHGTVGVASRCAPSMQEPALNPMFTEGADRFLAAGYVVAATDYQGLGTVGPHPYLVGEVEAANALDSARAARNLVDSGAGEKFVVWGHSQGGHAAVFTGQQAASYAPELRLLGVAAGAPAPDLIDLFAVNVKTTVGKVLISMAIDAWANTYQAASLDQIVAPAARPVVRKIARNCLFDAKQVLASVPSALALKVRFLTKPPWDTEPWKTIAADNTPGGRRIGVPILVVQSDADAIIDPAVTRAYVGGLCRRGETVELRMVQGLSHVETGPRAAAAVAAWAADRFADKPAATTCDRS